MDISDRIQYIIDGLEEALSYEEWNRVEDARKELLFLLSELDSDFPSTEEEDF
jgi:hypothetical protein